jgi:hypothetical protein
MLQRKENQIYNYKIKFGIPHKVKINQNNIIPISITLLLGQLFLVLHGPTSARFFFLICDIKIWRVFFSQK